MAKWIMLFLFVGTVFGLNEGDFYQLQVTYERSSDGGYDVNPDDYLNEIELYNIYAIQRFPQADSIVGINSEIVEDEQINGQTLVFTIQNHVPQIDYYVLQVTRDYGEWRENFFIAFEDSQTVLQQSTNTFDFHLPCGLGYCHDMWNGDPGEYMTAEAFYDDDGDFDYSRVELHGAERLYDRIEFPLLDLVALGPTTLCAMWDDTVETESGYKLSCKKWSDAAGEWSAAMNITLPPNTSGYCINGVDPSSLYLVETYPLGVAEADTLLNVVKSHPLQDPAEMDYLHYLPQGEITGVASDDGLIAYTYVYGWDYEEETHYYDYLLIKRRSGAFTLVELFRSDTPDQVFITDVAVSGDAIYVSHTQEDIFKIFLPDDNSTAIQALNVDLEGGHVKDMEYRHGKIFMAIKHADYVMGGSQPALGILDPAMDQLGRFYHPDIASGCDLLTVEDNLVYCAENYSDGSANTYSRIVVFHTDGETKLPIAPLPEITTQEGITDMAVNPVTGEMVYFSPTYGLWGSYGNNYNTELDMPVDFGRPLNLTFTDSGTLFMTNEQELQVLSATNAYEAVTSSVVPQWQGEQFDNPFTGSLALAAATVLPMTPADEMLLVGAAGTLAFTAIAAAAISSLLGVDIYYPEYYLGSVEYFLEKEVVIEETIKKFRYGSLRWLLRNFDFDENYTPVPGPKPLIDPVVPIPKTLTLELKQKRCQVEDDFFTENFFTFDVYHDLAKNGLSPFDQPRCANRECIGAYFSKFFLVEVKDSYLGNYYRCYVSKPLTYETRTSISFAELMPLFADDPECFGQVFSGWISYGPWRRHDNTLKSKTKDYFFITDASRGAEPYSQKDEFTSAQLVWAWEAFVQENPYLRWKDFYIATNAYIERLPFEPGQEHPNMPAPGDLFYDRELTLRNMILGMWRTDEINRLGGAPYFKDPEERERHEYYFNPTSDKLVHRQSGVLLTTGTMLRFVMACNEQIFGFDPIEGLVSTPQVRIHSQLLGGAHVICAGSITARDGRPISIDNNSGHYRPRLKHLENAAAVFAKHGWHERSREHRPGSPFYAIHFTSHMVSLQTQSYFTFGHGSTTAGVFSPTDTMNKILHNEPATHFIVTTRLFDGEDEEFATDLELVLSNGQSLDPVEESADQFATFEIPLDTLETTTFMVQGCLGQDSVYSSLDYQFYLFPQADQDTIVLEPGYVEWMPDAGTCDIDQKVFIAKQGRESYGESDIGTRYNFLIHFAAEQQIGGTLCFAYTHGAELGIDKRTALFHRNQAGDWSEIPALLAAGDTVFKAQISEPGTYGMFVIEDDGGAGQNQASNVSIRTWLQGADDAANSNMSTALNDQNQLPYDSPYDESSISMEGVPDTLVDWVCVELLSDPGREVVWQSGMLLGEQGWLITPDGEPEFVPDIAAGNYWIRIRHRNHLCVLSAGTIPLRSEGSVVYSFVQTEERFHASTPARRMDSGQWAMVSGDINGDGHITSKDYVELFNEKSVWSQEGSGYYNADLNFDGQVDNADYCIWKQNAVKGFSVTEQ
jgi:hypothetical protein